MARKPNDVEFDFTSVERDEQWLGISGRFQWNFSPEDIIVRKGLTRDFYKEVAKVMIEYMEPYVPYKEGKLSSYVQGFGAKDHATVTYQMPYASKQYYNIGANFTKQFHPLATSFWDKAMWENSKDLVIAEVDEIRKRYSVNE